MNDPNGHWQRNDVRRRAAQRRAGRQRLVALALVFVPLLAVGGYALTRVRSEPAPPPPPPALVPVTFPEGFRFSEMAQSLGSKSRLSAERYLALAADPARVAAVTGNPKAPSLEGYLFPATYELRDSASSAMSLALVMAMAAWLARARVRSASAWVNASGRTE